MSSPYEMIRTHLSAAVPFANTVGVSLVEIADGTARAVLDQVPANENHIQTQHAGAMFTLGEAASGAALAGALAPVLLTSRAVAKDARIAYLKVAKGTRTANAATDRPGKNLLADLARDGKVVFDVTVDIVDGGHETVAEMVVAWHVSPLRT